MTVLAIDTSRRGHCLALLCEPDGRAMAVRRAGTVGQALDGFLVPEPLQAVVVATGPGSYTGVRAGMAAGLGIAQARDIPMHGVGSLEVVAHGAPDTMRDGLAVAAAGRGALYGALFARSAAGLRIAPARWVAATGMAAVGEPLVSFDDLPLPGLLLPDAAPGLAAAVPLALARPPLERVGLSAHHVVVLEPAW